MRNSIVVDTPVMTIDKFAEKAGVTPASVRSMVTNHQIPTKKMGKRRFINIAALTNECLQDAQQNLTSDDE
jgi:hypothetical protein